MATQICSALLSSIILSALLAQTPPEMASWNNLRHITRGTDYIIVDRDRKCFMGKLGRVNDNSVTLKQWKRARMTVARQRVLRLCTVRGGMYYSGRSSWLDVESLGPKQEVRITTKSGGAHPGSVVSVLDDRIILQEEQQRFEFARKDIATVEEVADKPLSDATEYASHELLDWIFFPQLWPYVFRHEPRTVILLYDSSKPEENSSVSCWCSAN